MALFANSTRRTQVAYRRRNWFGINISQGCINLIQTGQFGTDVPVGSRSHMTINATNFSMG